MRESTLRILLVEDNPADVLLIRHSLELSTVPHSLDVVNDGQQALDFLYRRGAYVGEQRPDLVVMSLHLLRVSSSEVLRHIKADDSLAALPVLILAGGTESDVLRAYKMHANCYIRKPSDLDEYVEAIRLTVEYWSRVVRLPGRVT
jgi:two-component system response regulator